MTLFAENFSPWRPLPRVLPFEANAVHVCQTTTELSPPALAHLSGLLSDDERQRVNQLRIPAKRVQGIIARGLTRDVLSRCLNIQPHHLLFTLNDHGKPRLHATHRRPTVFFNVSHTAGRVLLAVACEREVGVDVETIRPLPHEELAQRFFSSTEHAAIMNLPPLQRPAAFFLCWTRKEALLKAVGRGISAGLKAFQTPVTPSPSPLFLQSPPFFPPCEWSLHDLSVGAGLVASLAVQGRDAQIFHWNYAPRNPAAKA